MVPPSFLRFRGPCIELTAEKEIPSRAQGPKEKKRTFPILSNKSVCVPCTAVKGAISGFAVALFLICAKHSG